MEIINIILIVLAFFSGIGLDKIIDKILSYQLNRNRIKFEGAHKERIKILPNLYKKIKRLEEKFQSLVAPFQEGGEPALTKKAKETASIANDFIDYFNDNRLYLNNELEEKIDNFSQELRKGWLDYKYSTGDFSNKEIEAMKKNWHRAKDDLPRISNEIKDDFRKILGIE